MIRLCFDNLQYGCRYAAILFAAELKRSWQQSSALTVTQEESQCVKTLFFPPLISQKSCGTHIHSHMLRAQANLISTCFPSVLPSF